MNKYYVFFDVDGTVLQKTSMISFLEFFYHRKFHSKILGKIAQKIFTCKSRLLLSIGKTRNELNRQYYRCFKNQDKAWLDNLGYEWFIDEIENNPSALYDNVLKELKHHQTQGAEIVFVSGSFGSCLEPLAKKLGVNIILASKLVEINRCLTGDIYLPPTIGEGKSEKIIKFLLNKKYVDLNDCYAYGDHESDIPMLSLVGNPVAIAGRKILENYANRKGWKILQP
jgi:HAD superfamily hydrolase (TIGR01490 family)